jgi:hypothetical protein
LGEKMDVSSSIELVEKILEAQGVSIEFYNYNE